jgi:glycosyltransferase involved in cell wall biosynthesis
MRILMLAQSYAPVVGGEERIVEDLSVELARRGHEVHVATLRQPVGEPPRSADGVAVHLLESALQKLPGLPTDPERSYAPPAPDPLAVRGLRRLLAEIEPDVVHGHNWLADSYLPLDRSDGPAFVLSLHDYSLICATKRLFLNGGVCSGPGARKCLAHSLEHYGAAKGPLTALGTAVSDRWLRRRVDVFLPVSEAVRDLCGIAAAPHRVIPNFIGSLPPAPPPGEPALGALPEEPFIFYFGDVTEDKGVGVLVEAYAGLAGAPPLVLAGRRLLELPATPGVVELGRLPHPVAIEALRRALFTVAPTILPESFGIVALEAAAAGKAAIASEIGGLKDVVRDGETGLLVPPGRVEPLRAALRRLSDDEGLRRRLGEAASRRALEFSPAAVVPRFESAYEDAITLRRGR